MKISPNSKLVMIGDSITDCGRAQPIGEGIFDALGDGYVSLINGLVAARYPAHRIRVVNTGVGGNTVRDLKGRWQTDVLDLKPDWLSVMIGINDVWRHFDAPLLSEWHVSLEEYANTLDELLRMTRPGLQGLVLMTPYFIEPNRADAMRAMMDQYGEVVRQLAVTHEATLVDTQAAFDAILTEVHPMTIAGDRVHPSRVGHSILARSFLQAVGYEW